MKKVALILEPNIWIFKNIRKTSITILKIQWHRINSFNIILKNQYIKLDFKILSSKWYFSKKFPTARFSMSVGLPFSVLFFIFLFSIFFLPLISVSFKYWGDGNRPRYLSARKRRDGLVGRGLLTKNQSIMSGQKNFRFKQRDVEWFRTFCLFIV